MNQPSKQNTRFSLPQSYGSKHILILAFAVLCLNIIANLVYSFKGIGYPHNTFLLNPVDRFGDFFQAMDGLQIVDTWGGDHLEFIYFENFLPLTATLYFISAKLI